MSKDPEKGIKLIVDKVTGAKTPVAVGPVARIEWLYQVQDDPSIEHAALSVALAVTRFVNRKEGRAYPGLAALGKALNMSERAVRGHLSALIKSGHVLQVQRARKPALLYLLVNDRKASLRSSSLNDRNVTGQLSENLTGNSAATLTNACQNFRPEDGRRDDRKVSVAMTGKSHNLNEPNSDTYEDRTRRINSGTELGAAGGAPQARSPSSWGADRSIVGIPATLNHSASHSAGSLSRLTARSPASEEAAANSQPLAGPYELRPEDECTGHDQFEDDYDHDDDAPASPEMDIDDDFPF